MYATLIRAKAWKEEVLDKHPEAEFHIVCALGQTELQHYCDTRNVINRNLFKYLLRIPLKEIEAFIEQAAVLKEVREQVITPVQ